MQPKKSFKLVRRVSRKAMRSDMPAQKPTGDLDNDPVVRGDESSAGSGNSGGDNATATTPSSSAVGHSRSTTTLGACVPLAERGDLASSWTDLLELVETPTWLVTLRPFARFCVDSGFSPTAVNDDVLCCYCGALFTKGKSRWPKTSARRIAQAWNIQVGTVEGWPSTKLNAGNGGG